MRPNPTYIGFANYLAVLSDPIFLAALSRTLVYTLLSVVANLAFALGFAILLDSSLLKRGNLFFRLAIFLPVITPDVAGYVVWRWLYDRSFRALNAFLSLRGLPPFAGLSSVDTAMLSILMAELWHHAGFYMIIFLANLSIRDRALEERLILWRHHLATLVACHSPAIAAGAGDQRGLCPDPVPQDLHVVVVMTKGGPNDETNFVSYYAYQLFDQPAMARRRPGHHPVRHCYCPLAHGVSDW